MIDPKALEARGVAGKKQECVGKLPELQGEDVNPPNAGQPYHVTSACTTKMQATGSP